MVRPFVLARLRNLAGQLARGWPRSCIGRSFILRACRCGLALLASSGPSQRASLLEREQGPWVVSPSAAFGVSA